MTSRPAGPEHYERVDWQKVVYALTDYAYRALAPDTTWKEARVMARATIALALDEEDEWDPSEETLLRHLGRTLRDMVFVACDERGTGRRAREESPDWEIAKRTYATGEMRKLVSGRAGLPLSTAEYFRARRRVRLNAVDILRKLPLPPRRSTSPKYASRDEEIMDVILSSTDQDNFEDTMPRELLEELVRELGGEPEALWKSVGPWIQERLDERAKRLAEVHDEPQGIGSA